MKSLNRTFAPIAGFSPNGKNVIVAICGYKFSDNKNVVRTKFFPLENLLAENIGKIFLQTEKEIEKKNLSFSEKDDAEKISALCTDKEIFMLSDKSFSEKFGAATTYVLYVPEEILNLQPQKTSEKKLNMFETEVFEETKISLKVSFGTSNKMENKEISFISEPKILEDLSVKEKLIQIQNKLLEIGEVFSLQQICSVKENLELFK